MNVSYNDRILTYDVSGNTFEEIEQSMKKNTVDKNGYRFSTGYEWHIEDTENGKLLHFDLTVILPKLETKNLDSKIKNEWTRYKKVTTEHEKNHMKLYFTAFETIEKLNDFSKIKPMMDFAYDLNKQYDQITQYGILEGCMLNFTSKLETFTITVDDFLDKIRRFD